MFEKGRPFEHYSSTANQENEPELWIFGYGSLMWHPGFEYEQKTKGLLAGYARRFYQGNTTFRGTEKLPGRVVTLVQVDSTDQTPGVLFKVRGSQQIQCALEHLLEREIGNGYSFSWVDVHEMTRNRIDSQKCTIRALTCVADSTNPLYLGPSDADDMADQIAKAKGRAGPNTDYLFNLAFWAKKLFPDMIDDHLFELERLVSAIL
uniref:glutathione-specific gamma-glutamylcyclotransferase n=1 Tax=Romanomermis culicivorax TaxID=13658 RepID=A0A915JTW3_ROMCU